MQNFLNERGGKGWELVSVVKNNADVMVYFFKRPFEPEELFVSSTVRSVG